MTAHKSNVCTEAETSASEPREQHFQNWWWAHIIVIPVGCWQTDRMCVEKHLERVVCASKADGDRGQTHRVGDRAAGLVLKTYSAATYMYFGDISCIDATTLMFSLNTWQHSIQPRDAAAETWSNKNKSRERISAGETLVNDSVGGEIKVRCF